MPDGSPGHARRRVVLAVDLGSTAVKVGLVTERGDVLWWAQEPLQTVHGRDGAATQDADGWWSTITDLARRGLASGAVPPEQVGAIGVTGQFGSIVPVDASGAPVGPCLMWMDTRGARHSAALVGGRVQGYRADALVRWLRRTGGIPTVSGADTMGHLLYLTHDEPSTAAAARWYLEPVDYLTMRLTGQATATHASMLAAWLTDNRRLDVLEYDDELVRLSGVDRSKLPPLVRPASVVGPVTADVAERLGISPDCVVVTGTPDAHACAVGTGSTENHQAFLALGTTAWVSCPVPRKKTDLFRNMAAVPDSRPDGYLLLNNQETAGRSLQWFREQVAGPTDGLGPETPPEYDDLTGLAATVPAGAGGVIFTPWLLGERTPVDDRAARGGFHNLGLATTRAHLARAVLEGVAYNARWLVEGADHFTARRLEPLRLVGGCAQSDLWSQIVADVCGRPVERLEQPLLTGLRGTALYAGMVLGHVDRSAVRRLVPVDRTFSPDPANRAVYDRLFREFPGLYKSQRRMFHRLHRS